jgi:hypothetical protein
MNQLGAVAGKQYQGDGLSVRATATGAELRCAFQRLEGEVTTEGLWLRSTADGAAGERFRVLATGVGRDRECAAGSCCGSADWQSAVSRIGNPQAAPGWSVQPTASRRHSRLPTCATLTPLEDFGFGSITHLSLSDAESNGVRKLPGSGRVRLADQVAQLLRPGVTEEYSVSVDGVRQDFLIAQPPAGTGELRLELDVTGATVAPLGNGVRLTLSGSGRQLAYHRLHVTDATGRELPARMEVAAEMPAATKLTVLVDDANAEYPVRIDPTFSDTDWVSLGGLPGVGSLSGRSVHVTVSAAVTDAAGNLYIGGIFQIVHDTYANCVAKWDGASWSALGSGLNSNVYALAIEGTNLYVGGAFTEAGGVPANRIARWDGSTWTALGDGTDGVVRAIAISGQSVYVGGAFTNAGGVAAKRVARWNGSSWSPLGAGLNSDNDFAPIHAVVSDAFGLIMGGDFTTADGTQATNLARWDGKAWSPVGSAAPDVVTALLISGNKLYTGSDAGNVSIWDGNSWADLGMGTGSNLRSLAMVGTNLYAGRAGGGVSGRAICRWDGGQWVNLGRGVYSFHDSVYALTTHGTNLYVGGSFEFAGNFTALCIARWNGYEWSTLGQGMDVDVRAMAVSGQNMYASGGSSGMYGYVRLGKWDGTNWTTLGNGIRNGYVRALAVSGSNVYAGGTFNGVDNASARYIAHWDGEQWHAMVGDTNSATPLVGGRPHAIAIDGANVYVGGDEHNFVSRWDETNWHRLAIEINGSVRAIAVSGSNVFAGGLFTHIDGVEVNRIARWDGNSWSALGSGVDGDVYAITVSGSNLYVGGSFTNAGGLPANYVARWDGSAWSPLGSGLTNSIFALAVSGADLYAGGDHTIAKWDGNSWSTLDSGVGSPFGGAIPFGVVCMAVAGPKLYVGGGFLTAGDKISAYVAQANIGTEPGRFANLSYSPVTGFTCTFLDATPGRTYSIQVAPSHLSSTWTDVTNFIYAGPVAITLPPTNSTTGQFLRARCL